MPYVTSHDVRIFYEAEGSGPAIVFHTGAGGDSRIWREAGYVSGTEGFTRLLIDQRGRGRSDKPQHPDAHRMELFADDVHSVLQELGIPSAAFWGYSNGILVGIAFGGLFPNSLRCLVGTGALRFRDLTDLPRVDPEKEIQTTIAEKGVVGELESRMAKEDDRFPPAIDRNVRDGDPLMLALDGIAWRDWEGPRTVLERFHAPILLLTGEKEDPDRQTEDTVSRIRNARVIRVPNVGHLGAFYRSDLTLPHALPFLRDHTM